MTKKKLFEEFAPITSAQWKEQVISDLKGADFSKRLVWNTPEGFAVQPYYRAEDLNNLPINKHYPGGMPMVNRSQPGWKIRQEIESPGSPEACNEKLLNAIEKGAQSVGINMQKIQIADKKALAAMLNRIDPAITELTFYRPENPKQFSKLLRDYLHETVTDTKKTKGSLVFDPLEMLTCEGEVNDNIFDTQASMINDLTHDLPGFRLLQVNPGIIQDGGGTLSQELGFGLAMANEYLDKLSARGIALPLLAKNMLFSFATSPDYFMEIAKLRAARALWSAICKEWGLNESDTNMYIHSRSASWNLTLYDPNVNMLRTTTEAMAASIGGSDEISVLPFDTLFRKENDFTSRLARNTQVILKEEAYFDKVTDPAAGSYYIEQLTDKIAEQAWNIFTETETQGGYIEAFKSGFIPDQVTESAGKKRDSAVAGKHHILGVNQYPNFSELILNQEIEIKDDHFPESSKKTIRPFRVAAEIEKLRLRTEKSKKRPKVFLLKYGDPKWMTARAMFSGNFFACAGYEIIDPQGFETINDGISSARDEKADIVVICSSDDQYPDIGPIVKEALGSNTEVVIAGYPKESIDILLEKGIQHFIHVRSNLYEEINKFHSLMNIE